MCEGKINIKVTSSETFIAKAICKFGDGVLDFSRVNYIDAHSKIELRCLIHDEWFFKKPTILFGKHTNKPCPTCAKESGKFLTTLTQDEFITRVTNIHGNKYDYSKVFYTKTKNYIDIICNNCGETFKQLAGEHLRGRGCRNCVFKELGKTFMIPSETYFKKCNDKYGVGAFDYSESVYNGYYKDITIRCLKHGYFTVNAGRFSSPQQKYGCLKCASEGMGKSGELKEVDFLNKAKELYGDLYVYEKMDTYNRTRGVITFFCTKHNIKQTNKIGLFLDGTGCRECGIETFKSKVCTTYEEFVEKANKTHNNYYTYPSPENFNSSSKVDILCPAHGLFKQRVHSHHSGAGCPKCASQGNSKKEQLWLDSLDISKENRDYKLFIGGRIYKVDGYDPLTNTVYEFHGDYWHGNPLVFNRDDINRNNKTTFGVLLDETIDREIAIIRAGYRLVTMWERDYEIMKKEAV